MAEEGTYPDPSAEQSNAGAGPFYSQKTDSNIFSQLSQQLDNSARARERATPTIQHVHYAAQDARGSNHVNNQESAHPASHYEAADANTNSQMPSGGTIAEDALRAAAQAQHENQNLAQHMLTLDEDGHEVPDESQLSTRAKRAKVSRACDECRRKKIRCDALETDPAPTCSNCKRTGAQCRFSRMPLKRGPSKGYIKELADKINTLESRLGPATFAGAVQDGYVAQYGQGYEEVREGEEQSPTTRKRTHSMMNEQDGNGVDGGHNLWANGYSPGRASQSPWDQRQLPSMASALHNPHQSTHASMQEWQQGQNDGNRRHNEVASHDGLRNDTTAWAQGWDEALVDQCYRSLHRTFPILPHSMTRLRERFESCTDRDSIRRTFAVTLECWGRCSLHANHELDLQRWRVEAANQIALCQYEDPSTRSFSTNLLYLQTLMLMIFVFDAGGPKAAASRAEWLGRAIGAATHLKLHRAAQQRRKENDDPDSDEGLSRRLWWTLFILDRWHACSTGSLTQLPDTGIRLDASDSELLGESTYQLARLSHIVGHINMILQAPAELFPPNNSTLIIMVTLVQGELDRFRESIGQHFVGPPDLITTCYYHLRLLIHRLTATDQFYDLQELLAPTARLSDALKTRDLSQSSLDHHFLALWTLTMVELSGLQGCERVAKTGLQETIDLLEDPHGWDATIKSTAEGCLRRILEQDTKVDGASNDTGSGLQHLADAATAGQDGQRETLALQDFDFTTSLRQGYLAALTGLGA